MSDGLERIFTELLESTDKTSKELYEELKYALRNKMYGNREDQLAMFREFFEIFFEKQYEVFQVEWWQYQDYNDNWYYFDIQTIKVNQHLDLHHLGFDNADENVWEYMFTSEASEQQPVEDRQKAYAKLERANNNLRIHIDKVLVFLRALYDYYGGYYFIYVFGDRAKVTVSKEGILIDNETTDWE